MDKTSLGWFSKDDKVCVFMPHAILNFFFSFFFSSFLLVLTTLPQLWSLFCFKTFYTFLTSTIAKSILGKDVASGGCIRRQG